MKFSSMVVLFLIMAGCTSATHVVTGTVRPSVDPETVKIYVEEPKAYEVIAIIDASAEDSLAFTKQGEMDEVIAVMKKRAASLGANGILLLTTDSQSQIVGVPTGGGTIIAQDSFKTAKGKAIYVSEPQTN